MDHQVHHPTLPCYSEYHTSTSIVQGGVRERYVHDGPAPPSHTRVDRPAIEDGQVGGNHPLLEDRSPRIRRWTSPQLGLCVEVSEHQHQSRLLFKSPCLPTRLYWWAVLGFWAQVLPSFLCFPLFPRAHDYAVPRGRSVGGLAGSAVRLSGAMPARVPFFAAAVALPAAVHLIVTLRCHVLNFVSAIALTRYLLQELDPNRNEAH
ncbi:unnamed protein product [Euphydryas editha]|uniref:Uncharacterized protein n=1 Tax=Euphydryas editha TaxID=104508 RepID=A0AAU9VCP4_EUPED|nr:unnamed protein product [Euphydryas editha]